MLSISFDALMENQSGIITYATRNSDLFSLITTQTKPYSKRPPNCEHDAVLAEIQGALVAQIVGIREWSETTVKDNHTVMNIYRCSKMTRAFLLKQPNLFLYPSEFPEDICFYRGRQVWLSTTTHEKYASVYCETKADLELLDQLQIPYAAYGNLRPYQLPAFK